MDATGQGEQTDGDAGKGSTPPAERDKLMAWLACVPKRLQCWPVMHCRPPQSKVLSLAKGECAQFSRRGIEAGMFTATNLALNRTQILHAFIAHQNCRSTNLHLN
eukprot:1157553-Pelagomonas_calceolata.AAC.6